jgi:hypothetical protein
MHHDPLDGIFGLRARDARPARARSGATLVPDAWDAARHDIEPERPARRASVLFTRLAILIVALSGATVAAVATAGPVDRLVDSTAWSVPGARVLVHEVDGRAMGVEVSLIDGVVSLQRADGGAWTATYTPDVID